MKQASLALDRSLAVRALDQSADLNLLALPIKLQRSMIAVQHGDLASGEAFLERITSLAATEEGTDSLRTLDDSKGFRFRAQLAALLGKQELAVTWFDQATTSPARSIYLLRAPEIDSLRTDQEFQDLAVRLQQSIETVHAACPGLS